MYVQAHFSHGNSATMGKPLESLADMVKHPDPDVSPSRSSVPHWLVESTSNRSTFTIYTQCSLLRKKGLTVRLSLVHTHIIHFLLHSSLIATLLLAGSAACHHMTCPNTVHTNTVIGGVSAPDPGHRRPAAGCHVEERYQEKGARGGWEGADDGILAPGCAWFPLAIISWWYFEITPLCMSLLCVCRCKKWAEQAVMDEYPIVLINDLFNLLRPCFNCCYAEEKPGQGTGRNIFNPLNNIFSYLHSFCQGSRLLRILPDPAHSTNECQTDWIHSVGDIFLPSFNCLL